MKSQKKNLIKYKNTVIQNTVIRICCLAVSIAAVWTLSGCKRNTEPITRTGFYFDTIIQITLYDTEDTSVMDGCFQLAQSYQQMFSATLEGSDVWNINHSGGKDVLVSKETIDVLATAVEYAVLTHGAVDPTIRPVSELWHFGSEDEPCVPDQADIADALRHVSYKSIHLSEHRDNLSSHHNTLNDNKEDFGNHDDNTALEAALSGCGTVSLDDPEAAVDLGCIAKGYIADKMKEYLLSQGVHSACISLGGNVLAIGDKPDGSPFRIGIQEPFAPDGTSLGTVEIKDASVVTSGIYERCFEQNNVFYHHILDTATGYPVDNELAAVTILAPSSTQADILSTACLCLEPAQGRDLLDGFPDVEYLLIMKDGTQYCSDGFYLK